MGFVEGLSLGWQAIQAAPWDALMRLIGFLFVVNVLPVAVVAGVGVLFVFVFSYRWRGERGRA